MAGNQCIIIRLEQPVLCQHKVYIRGILKEVGISSLTYDLGQRYDIRYILPNPMENLNTFILPSGVFPEDKYTFIGKSNGTSEILRVDYAD